MHSGSGWLRLSPCCGAEIRRELFDDAMQGFCTACQAEVDRLDRGEYIVHAGHAPPIHNETPPA